MHRQDEANQRRNQQHRPDGVKLRNDLLPRQPSHHGLGLLRGVKEEQQADKRRAANGQVDVEAPAPRQTVRKGTAQQRARHARQGEDAAQQARDGRHSGGGDDEAGDGVASPRDAGGTRTLDGPPDDEGGRAGRRAADDGSDLEDEDGGEEGPLEREVEVCLAPVGLEGGERDGKG